MSENKPELKYEHRIVIGDWSCDGHNRSDTFTFRCTHDEREVKDAYLAAVDKSRVALHDKTSTGKSLKKPIVPVCCEYEDNLIKSPQVDALKQLGVSFDFAEREIMESGAICLGPEEIAFLFFEMVKTQLPGFEYKIVEEKRPINGYWSEDFNLGFGYGCYYG